MESATDTRAALAALHWQIELGAIDAIGDAPVNRYDLASEAPPRPKTAEQPAQTAAPYIAPQADPVAEAQHLAQAAADLPALRDALAAYEHCELKRGARNLVFSDGTPGARVLILGEAPGRDEDREGKPFVGRAGQLLDRMLAAIGLDRTATDPVRAAYITNVLPWRPPQNRDPKPQEIAMMLPFVQRHIALAAPDFVILMGNISCQAALGKRGILRLRGQWDTAFDRPALPMTHPAYLLRTPLAKREAWADLLSLKSRMETP